MKTSPLPLRPLLAAILLTFALRAFADVTPSRYHEWEAFRITDGKTEAVVVPEIARVMRFGPVGGANLLWEAGPETSGINGWKNYGGDKTWIAPQAEWKRFFGRAWPAGDAVEGGHKGEILDGKLRVESPLIEPLGVVIRRLYSFDPSGEFVIEQTIENRGSVARTVSLWSVTQTPPPQATYLPLNPASPYKNNYLWQSRPVLDAVEVLSPTLLRVTPSAGKTFKVGADAAVPAIAAVIGDVIFLQRTPPAEGEYPDGAPKAGLSVEFYGGGDAKPPYVELELLSPLRELEPGKSFSHTVRWSLHPLEGKHAKSPETVAQIEKLLNENPAR